MASYLERVHKNPSPLLLKNIAKNSKHENARIAIDKEGNLWAADGSSFLHQDLGGGKDYENIGDHKVVGYVTHHDGDYIVGAWDKGSNLTKPSTHPKLDKLYSAGFVNGTDDKSNFSSFKKGGSVSFSPVDHDSSAFRSWFGNSVLHDEGVPRTYYHGTSKDTDFKKFKMSRHGIWMTTDPKEASSYAAENDSQGFRAEGWSVKPTNTASRVIPVHARIEKPFVGEMPQDLRMKENYKKAQSDWFDSLRSQGYDGWVPKSENGNLAVALGHPGQIKSALSNTGDYSETGDINKADGGSVDDFIPHDDPRRQENFGNWFGYSHTVDERGNPMVLYHGTDADVDEFDPNKIGQTDHGWYGEGHYLTASPELASAYSGYKNHKAIAGEEIHPGQNVMPVYARLENPYYWPEDRAAATSKEEAKKITEELRKQGYDGVIAPNKHADMPEGKFWEVVVFTPHQIKSATGNSGHFNMQSPKLNKAEGGSVDDEDEGLTAYHGSPHDFEQFDINKIGTGEGAQAYGHGLYFAESEPVAKGYRDRLRQEYTFVDDKKIPHPSEENPESNLVYTLANQLYQMGWNTDQAIDFANKHAESLKDDLTSENFYKKGKAEHAQKWARDIAQFKGKKIEWKQDPGNMYEVRIKAKPEHFLDWDEPLYRQPEAVRRLVGITPEYENEWFKWFKQDNDSLLNALENDGDYRSAKEPARPQGGLRMMMNGSDIYEHLHNKMGAIDWPIDADSSERANVRKTAAERVSQYLKENGVPGIKYLDAGSRGAGEGSRNYVVFDHDLVKVKRKYAWGGAV